MAQPRTDRVLLFLLLFTAVLAISGFDHGARAESVSESGGVIKQTLKNGVTVIVDSNTSSDIVVVHLFIKMGALAESRDQSGISSLMQRVLLKGTTSRSGQEINLQTETFGASVNTGYSPDYGLVSLKTTVDALPKCLPIYLDIIQNPVFAEAEVSKEREKLIQELRGAGDQAINIAVHQFLTGYYGMHPYGIRTEDLIKSIGSVTRKDIMDWYRRVYIPQNMVVSVAGKVNAKEILEKFNQSLGKMPQGSINVFENTRTTAIEQDKLLFKVKQTQSLCVLVGYPAPDVASPDRVPMNVLNWILGASGMNSRLFTDLREEKGLAYHVSSSYPMLLGPSYIYAYLTTAPSNYSGARDGLIAEFKKFSDVKISEKELQTAKRAMRGRLLLENETAADRSYNRGVSELIGLGYDFDKNDAALIERVTAEDIQRVARNYFKHYIVSVVSPTEIK